MPDVGIQPLPRARTWGAVATCVQQHARVSTKPRMRFPGRREGVQVPRSFRSISHSRTHMLIHICARVRAHVHTRTQHTHTHSCRLLCVHAGTQLTHVHGYTHTHIHLHWHTHAYIRASTRTHPCGGGSITHRNSSPCRSTPHPPCPSTPRRSSALAMQTLSK